MKKKGFVKLRISLTLNLENNNMSETSKAVVNKAYKLSRSQLQCLAIQ